jgi:hypothetical protein
VSRADTWSLRCGVQFLDEVTEALYDGGAWVRADRLTSEGLVDALQRRLEDERWVVLRVDALQGRASPTAAVAGAFDVSPSRLALATPLLSQHAVLIDLRDCPPGEWTDFARFYAATRRQEGTGLAILILATTPAPAGLRSLSWQGRIRRADAGLWADSHALTHRVEPLGHLVHAIAVDLIGWRLDLVRSFMQVDLRDALDPLGWLERREEDPAQMVCDFGGKAFACPLDLVRRGDRDALRNRLWRAHLAAIFPWIEEQRQGVLDRYADLLRVSDMHREKLGVENVADLEISEIAKQLRNMNAVPRHLQAGYDALGSMRKALAHRVPAQPRDLRTAFDALSS